MPISKINPNSLGGVPCFSAYSNANQSVANATNTKVAFQVEEFDTNSNFDSTTNYRFTPTVAGYYKVTLSLGINSDANIRTLMTQIYKNGSQHKIGWTVTPASAGTYIVSCNAIVFLNGSTDYVEGYVYQNTGSSQNVVTNSTNTYFQAAFVRAA